MIKVSRGVSKNPIINFLIFNWWLNVYSISVMINYFPIFLLVMLSYLCFMLFYPFLMVLPSLIILSFVLANIFELYYHKKGLKVEQVWGIKKVKGVEYR